MRRRGAPELPVGTALVKLLNQRDAADHPPLRRRLLPRRLLVMCFAAACHGTPGAVVSVLCFFFVCVCVCFFVFLCFGLGFDLIPGGTEIAGPGCLEKDGKERLEARWGRGGRARP